MATAACAADLPALPGEDARVERGATVVRERTVDGWPWPEIVVYRRSAAPAAAIMAVYADFEAQSSFIPGIVTSRVLGHDSANATRVFYESEVTGPNEQYTVVTTVTNEGNAWLARWTLVSARYARRLEGSLRVVPRGTGSLVVYSSLVDPGRVAATVGTPATVATRLTQTAEALTARTERLATAEPKRLAALVDALRSGSRAKETPAR